MDNDNSVAILPNRTGHTHPIIDRRASQLAPAPWQVNLNPPGSGGKDRSERQARADKRPAQLDVQRVITVFIIDRLLPVSCT